MIISICQTIFGADREPLHRRMVASTVAATLPPGWGLEWCLCRYGDAVTSYLPAPYRVLTAPLPFSLGGGRNVAARAATGDVLAFIDCDMLLPVDFWGVVCPLVERDALALVCPTYDRIMANGARHQGFGWGNLICRRALFARTHGYEPRTTWGGEDTAAINVLKAAGGVTYRLDIAGFDHQWHPKAGAWYDGKQEFAP